MDKARAYVENWKEAYKNNTGLLLFGDVGTGKSFFAGCIANALLDRDVPVLMTNFPTILNRLTGMFSEDRADFIASFDEYDLLIIDDLGVERSTEYAMEQMKEPYVKEIDPGLHALQAEVGGDIAASYPFDDPVGLVLNDEGKLSGLDLNRSLWDEHGEIYDIVVGTFLVVGLGTENFASLPPDMIQKYTERFKRPELFASINGQIVSVPVEPENPLHTAEMTLEDDYGMIDGIINNGHRGEELEKAQTEARRTTPEKKPSIRERLEDAKRECAERKSPDKSALQKKPPELGDL